MKIIVQAGGLGSRLRPLTANRPKCLVPVLNRPLLFHLFEKYPREHFIIIGDYRYEVLQAYLECFAHAYHYTLIRASGQGNLSGLGAALEYVADAESFMVIWSDLLLAPDFHPELLPRDNYMGLLPHTLCSWRFQAGVLEAVPSAACGVAGCFIFRDRRELGRLPQSGSFTQWLRERGLHFQALVMEGCREIGTHEALAQLTQTGQRCRPYNHLSFGAAQVVKTALTDEARELLRREADWYGAMERYGMDFIPRIYAWEPLTMERIAGSNLLYATLSAEGRVQAMGRLCTALAALHARECHPACAADLIQEYYTKTLARLQSIAKVIPFAGDELIMINGRQCRNPLYFKEALRAAVQDRLLDTVFCPIHGDCTLSNVLLDGEGRVYLIDARGYFGRQRVLGDPRYDWAKLYYSVQGNFDRFNIGDFQLEIRPAEVCYTIGSAGWEDQLALLLQYAGSGHVDELRFIHAIIWLSLASHCWEDYDAMCLAFYNGCALVQDYL